VKKKAESDNNHGEMSLSGHLRELRNRLLVCVILLVVTVLAGLHFAPDIVTYLLDIGRKYRYQFVYIAPQEMLMEYVSVSVLFGIVVTLPVLIYETWAFIRPGLKKGENLTFLLAMLFGLLCFGIGVAFALRIMLPFMLSFLITLSIGSGVSASISVQSYMSFLMTVFVVFGATFELPVVSVLLNQIGVLKVRWMRKGRRVVIVVIFFVAALITPPDVVSQVMIAIPMMALYELSILLCTVFQKIRERRKKNAEAEDIP